MAGQGPPLITYSNLVAVGNNVDITKSTIQVFAQATIGPGFYTVGGVPAGLKAYASSLGISANAQYLTSYWQSEAVTQGALSLPTQAGYIYKYIPSLDVIQIFSQSAATDTFELGASEPIPPGVLNDIIIVQAIWVRL